MEMSELEQKIEEFKSKKSNVGKKIFRYSLFGMILSDMITIGSLIYKEYQLNNNPYKNYNSIVEMEDFNDAIEDISSYIAEIEEEKNPRLENTLKLLNEEQVRLKVSQGIYESDKVIVENNQYIDDANTRTNLLFCLGLFGVCAFSCGGMIVNSVSDSHYDKKVFEIINEKMNELYNGEKV